QKALTRMPTNIEFWDSYGWALFKRGEVEKGINILEIAIQREGAHPEVYEHLGDAYASVGRQREAIYMWKRALFYKDIGLGVKDVEKIESKITESSLR
ncbi:MAG: hypothetical protein JXQ74_04160, partial [Alphaproteobacteria bacterium]|nr:hypothetical protein [Alphaproteobacteria bacterium]